MTWQQRRLLAEGCAHMVALLVAPWVLFAAVLWAIGVLR